MFVVDDEGVDAVAQAFFYHEHSANTAVAIFEGVDLLEAGVEVKDITKGDFFFVLVFCDQGAQSSRDGICIHAKFIRDGSVCTDVQCSFLVGPGASEQFVVKLAKPNGSDWICNGIHHVLTCAEVVGDFYNIVDLHGFKGYGYFTCSVDFQHLFSGQSVTCHTAGTVGQIDLKVLVDTKVVVLCFLVGNLVGQRLQRCALSSLLGQTTSIGITHRLPA